MWLFGRIYKSLNELLKGQRIIMGQLDDLTAAVSNVQSDDTAIAEAVGGIGTFISGQLTTDINDIISLLQSQGGDNPQIAQAITNLQQVHADLQTAGSGLQTASANLTTEDQALQGAVGQQPQAKVNPAQTNPASQPGSTAAINPATGKPYPPGQEPTFTQAGDTGTSPGAGPATAGTAQQTPPSTPGSGTPETGNFPASGQNPSA